MGVAAVIAGAAVVGAGASVYAGSKAASAQKKASKNAVNAELQMYNQTREDQAPYREVGQGALYKLADMYGVSRPVGSTTTSATPAAAPTQPRNIPGLIGSVMGGTGFQIPGSQTGVIEPQQEMTPGYEGFQTSPGYQWRLNEGMKAVERSAAARGLLGSGATLKAVQRYGEGLASSEYENYANRLAALAGVGQTSVAQTGAAGAQAAGGMAQAYTNAGNARASAYQNAGQAISNTAGGLASAYLYSKGYGTPSPPVGTPPYIPPRG